MTKILHWLVFTVMVGGGIFYSALTLVYLGIVVWKLVHAMMSLEAPALVIGFGATLWSFSAISRWGLPWWDKQGGWHR